MIIGANREPEQWFAWFPVHIGWGEWAWLQTVWRARAGGSWEYRLTKEQLIATGFRS